MCPNGQAENVQDMKLKTPPELLFALSLQNGAGCCWLFGVLSTVRRWRQWKLVYETPAQLVKDMRGKEQC